MGTKKSRRVFTKEFKKEIVYLVTSGGRRTSEVAREFEIHRATIDRWVREFSDNSDNAFPGNGNLLPADEEIRRLKQELASLKEDRDILKKALAFFSRHSK
jgi:transposase